VASDLLRVEDPTEARAVDEVLKVLPAAFDVIEVSNHARTSGVEHGVSGQESREHRGHPRDRPLDVDEVSLCLTAVATVAGIE